MPDPSSPSPFLSTKAVVIKGPGSPIYPFQRKVQFASEEIAKEVREDFKRIYQHWNSQGNFRSRLQQWQNDSEGISDPVTSPWPDASAIVKPIIETRQNIIHSFFMDLIRPLIGKLFSCAVSYKATAQERANAVKMAAFFNANREFSLMYVDSLDEGFWMVLQDGTVGRTCDWLRTVEKRWERKTFNTLDELVNTYPDAESLGLKAEEYQKLLQDLGSNPVKPVALDLEHELITVDRPDIDSEAIKDLVIYPMTVSRQERTRFIGKFIKKRASELKALVRDGFYTKSVVDKLLEKTPSDQTDIVDQQRNSIEGISEPEKKEDYKHIHGRYLRDLDGDGIEEKYLVTYSVDAEDFVQFDKYPFWHNEDNIELSWFKRRAKRMLGRGPAEMLSDTQLEASIQARFRINSNAITNAPVIIVNDSLKTVIDPSRKDSSLRPGRALYIPENKWDKAIKPLEFPKREFGDAQREEANLDRSADNLLGASELRSGRETPSDPRAPAAKTALLLQKSGERLDDFIFGFILRENKVLNRAKKLYYQFGPEKIQFNVDDGGQLTPEEVQSSWFNSENISLQLSVTSLMDNPDYLRQKWEEFYTKYGPEPMLGAIPDVRHEMLNQILLNMPEARGVKLLMPLDQIRAAMSQAAPGAAAPGAPAAPPGINPTLEGALAGMGKSSNGSGGVR